MEPFVASVLFCKHAPPSAAVVARLQAVLAKPLDETPGPIDPFPRSEVIAALGRCGPRALPAVPELVRHLRDAIPYVKRDPLDDPFVQRIRDVALALDRIGPGDDSAATVLQVQASGQLETTRVVCAQALRRITGGK
jgi:hypothetical protein